MPSMPRPAVGLFTLLALLGTALPARAHNGGVHRAMTDRAYAILVALSKNALATGGDPGLVQLAAEAGPAIRKLQRLPAGLPAPKQSRCVDLAAIKKFGPGPLDWGVGATGSFEAVSLARVRYPVALEYITGNECGADPYWTSGAFYDAVTAPEAGGRRDYTGEVLGFWAHQPDDEEDDWHLFLVRPSNAVGISQIKQYIESAGGATAGVVWVSVRCAVTCFGDFFGLGGDCKACLDQAIEEAKQGVHEAVSTVDGLLPGLGNIHDAALLSGMGHHLNVVPGAPADYDDRAGLLFDRAGPTGEPDPVEVLATLATDVTGTSVRYDKSAGPKEYEVRDGRDFHPDSRHREAKDWEFLSLPHTPFTPVDNLGFSGWAKFRGAPAANLRALGWPLHAIGDAIVPMHVAATFGWGHRPYEDAFENKLSDYLFLSDPQGAIGQGARIARRALVWRQVILDWRAAHPEKAGDVPVRDLVTRLAGWTWSQVPGPSQPEPLSWPFNRFQSAAYLEPVLGNAASIAFYENFPGADAINQRLLEEGIAVELAFLISAAEGLP